MAATGITGYLPESESADARLIREAFDKWNQHELHWRFS
jgi:hypothetical protein